MNDRSLENTTNILRDLAAKDKFVQWLGIDVLQAMPGVVEISMVVREEHISFNGTCHGGVLFSLADTAFGLASNAHGVIAVGIHADVAFCAPATVGAQLNAKASEVSRSKRVGTYNVEITSERETIAIFLGTVHITEKLHE